MLFSFLEGATRSLPQLAKRDWGRSHSTSPKIGNPNIRDAVDVPVIAA